jgi:single-strand DNA-binding protein
MAGNANLVILMGNLTRDPELRYIAQGRAVTTLGIAVNRVYKDRDTGQQVKNTDFISVSVWGKQAENCEKYLSKGRAVYVEGRLKMNKWEDANGESRSKLEVVANNVQFLSGPSAGSKQDDNARSKPEENDDVPDFVDAKGSSSTEDEEIPF